MKKKRESTLSYFAPVQLYRGDLDEILEIVTTSCAEKYIADKEFEYESIDELQARRGNKTNRVEIRGYSPYLKLEIGLGATSLYQSDGVEAISPAFQIAEILKRRKRKVISVILNPILCLPVIGLLFLFTPRYVSMFVPETLATVIQTALVAMIAALSGFARIGGVFSRINLIHKHEKQGFWERNRDELVRESISHLLAFGLGLLAAYLLFVKGMK